MPHVTGCTPSTMPGRGIVDPELWDNRHRDPVRLRHEFQGPKGRGWLMPGCRRRAGKMGSSRYSPTTLVAITRRSNPGWR